MDRERDTLPTEQYRVYGLSEQLVVPPEPAVVPADLNPGDPYHLVFVTQGMRDGTSAAIADYDAFVNAEAALNPSVTGTGVQWYAIASTASVSARDHAVVGANVPVYLLDGTTKIADGYADIWDGSIDSTIDVDQFLVTLDFPRNHGHMGG